MIPCELGATTRVRLGRRHKPGRLGHRGLSLLVINRRSGGASGGAAASDATHIVSIATIRSLGLIAGTQVAQCQPTAEPLAVVHHAVPPHDVQVAPRGGLGPRHDGCRSSGMATRSIVNRSSCLLLTLREMGVTA
jgi:hypothetical protein